MTKKKGSAFETNVPEGSAFDVKNPQNAPGSAFETDNPSNANGSAFETDGRDGSAFATTPSVASESSVQQAKSAFDITEQSSIGSSKYDFILKDKYGLEHRFRKFNGEQPRQGAMGEVSIAYLLDGQSEQKVLIKKFPEQSSSNPSVHKAKLKLFSNEAVITCENGSKGRFLANGKFMGKDDYGNFFLVMDFYEGKDLKAIISEKAFREYPGNCKIIIRGILEGLVELHDQGVIHRDLKPENVMVRSDNGKPVLLDFGLACKTGMVDLELKSVGTYGYAAPEQQDGKGTKTDFSADIYALGIIFLEIVTPGFDHSTDKIDESIKIGLQNLDKNAACFKDFILKCVEKNPENRYQRADDALEQFISFATINHNTFRNDCIDPYWDDGIVDDKEKNALIKEAKELFISKSEVKDDFENAKKLYNQFRQSVRRSLVNPKVSFSELVVDAERKASKPVNRKYIRRIVESERKTVLASKKLTDAEKKIARKSLHEQIDKKMWGGIAAIFLIGVIVFLMLNVFKKENYPIPSDPEERNALLLKSSGAGDAIYVHHLLNGGAYLDIQNAEGETPLYAASKLGALPVVDTLLNHSPKVDVADNEGWTPLFVASCKGNQDVVEHLLASGANVSKLDKQNRTALTLAVNEGHDEIALMLLKKSSAESIQESYASLMGYAKKGSTKKLIDDAKNKLAQIYSAIEKDDVEGLKTALDYRDGSDLTSQDSSGASLLHFAVSKSGIKSIEYLINRGLPVDSKDSLGLTPLMLATRANKLDAVKILVQNGADIQIEDEDRRPLISTLKNGDIKSYIVDKMYADSLFIVAANKGDLEGVKHYIHEGAHVNFKDKNGMPAIAYAIKNGNEPLFTYLLQNKTNLNGYFGENNSAVNLAVLSKNEKILAEVLKVTDDYDLADANKRTPLLNAARLNQWNMVSLIMAKPNINLLAKDDKQNTLMHYAALYNKMDIVAQLKDKISINEMNSDKQTPLHMAAQNGSLDLVKLLVSLGSSVSTKDKKGKTPWAYANDTHVKKYLYDYENSNALIFDAVKKKNRVQVEQLLNYGASASASDSKGVPLIHYAIGGRDTTILSLLLRQPGVNVNATNGMRETPAHIAVSKKDLYALVCLKKHGAGMMYSNENGESIIHYAVSTRDTSVVSVVLKLGADINARNSHGETALFYAIGQNNLTMSKLLISRGANYSILNAKNQTALKAYKNSVVKALSDGLFKETLYVEAAMKSDVSKMNKYIAMKVPVDYTDNNHYLASVYAVHNENLNALKFLDKMGADFALYSQGYSALTYALASERKSSFDFIISRKKLRINAPNADGDAAIHLAVTKKDTYWAESLIKRGAKINLPGQGSITPLMIAIKNGNGKMIALLLKSGANINAMDKSGNTAMHYAAKYGNKDMVEALVKSGGSLEIENKEGNTPYKVAKASENKAVLKTLKTSSDMDTSEIVTAILVIIAVLIGLVYGYKEKGDAGSSCGGGCGCGCMMYILCAIVLYILF